MPPDNLDEMNDEEVMDRLDKAYLSHLLETDPKWKVIANWLRSQRDLAQKQLSLADASRMVDIVRFQEQIKIYNHLAEKIFVGIKKDAELALLEAQERGLVPESAPPEVPTEETTTGA